MNDWRPGARVAVLSEASYGGRRVDVATVERVTATQVVLGSGRRFRRDDGREVGSAHQRGYGMVAQLRPLDDPQVREVCARQAVAALVRRIGDVHKKSDPVATLEFVEQECARVRAHLKKLTREGE